MPPARPGGEIREALLDRRLRAVHRLLDHTADHGTESHDSLQVLRAIGTQQLTT